MNIPRSSALSIAVAALSNYSNMNFQPSDIRMLLHLQDVTEDTVQNMCGTFKVGAESVYKTRSKLNNQGLITLSGENLSAGNNKLEKSYKLTPEGIIRVAKLINMDFLLKTAAESPIK